MVAIDSTFEAHLKKDTASLGTVIENRQVTGLPLDGRNFYELSLLVPGAVPPAQGSAGSVRGDFAFSVNGAREDTNNFLLDGVYNVDPKLNTFGVRPPVDAIREFEMLTSTYDASFGRNPGAQVNVVLKSGSQRFSRLAFRVSSQRARSMRATSSRRQLSRNQNTSATSLAVRSVVQSNAIARSSLPTTKARARAKASRASQTCRRCRNAPETFRKACLAFRSIRSPACHFHGGSHSRLLHQSGRSRDRRALSAAKSQRAVCRTSSRRRRSATTTTVSTCASIIV